MNKVKSSSLLGILFFIAIFYVDHVEASLLSVTLEGDRNSTLELTLQDNRTLKYDLMSTYGFNNNWWSFGEEEILSKLLFSEDGINYSANLFACIRSAVYFLCSSNTPLLSKKLYARPIAGYVFDFSNGFLSERSLNATANVLGDFELIGSNSQYLDLIIERSSNPDPVSAPATFGLLGLGFVFMGLRRKLALKG